jgi:dihydrolipoamide dehydrogenase
MSESFDLVVIGAGPGGYVAAIRAAQLGMKVACVDKRPVAGGTCLNVGCIPSKALLTSSHHYWQAREHFKDHGLTVDIQIDLKKMQHRKETVVAELTKGIEFLFKKNGVTFLTGSASIASPTQVHFEKGEVLETAHILIATGSESVSLPTLPIDEETVVSSTGALNFEEVPEHLVVVGAGAIGLELGSVWVRLGSQVTVIDRMERLVPSLDADVASVLQKNLSDQGIVFRLGHQVISRVSQDKGLALHIGPAPSEGAERAALPEIISCDKVLVAVGRRPYVGGLGLESLGIQTDQRGFVSVNNRFQTAVPTIFAIGDVIRGPLLAHKAEEEGVAVAEQLAGQAGRVNYAAIPSIIYTQPEVASVGITEDQAKEEGLLYKIGKSPFSANSRAKAAGETPGFVKVIADAKTDRLLGVHIVGEQAGTMIAEAALALEFCASAEDIARTCHAHPTHSEALKEAALAASFGKV